MTAETLHQDEWQLDGWTAQEHPGYLSANRDEQMARWNQQYGVGNWLLLWQMPNGELWDFAQVYEGLYVKGYVNYLLEHPDEAEFLANNFSHADDLTPLPPQLARSMLALYQLHGLVNQFHQQALNEAIYRLYGGFRGNRPLAVRGPETEGHRWGPGYIPAPPEFQADNYPQIQGWWRRDIRTVEGEYQARKTLYVRNEALSGSDGR